MDFQKVPITIRFDKPGTYFLWTTGKGSIIGSLGECETPDELEAHVENAYRDDMYSIKDKIDSGDTLIAQRRGRIK